MASVIKASAGNARVILSPCQEADRTWQSLMRQ